MQAFQYLASINIGQCLPRVKQTDRLPQLLVSSVHLYLQPYPVTAKYNKT